MNIEPTMKSPEAQARRDAKATAFRALVRGYRARAKDHPPTPANILDCLSRARLCAKEAVSSRLSREVLLREAPGTEVPAELSDGAIAEQLVDAASLLETASRDYVVLGDLPRAYKYLRRAARLAGEAAQLKNPSDEKLIARADDLRQRAAAIRQACARHDIFRKRWSLGLLGRRR